MSFFSIVVILFLIMDPLGNLPSYLKLVDGLDPKRRTVVVVREMIIALAFMLGFYFVGDFLFKAFQFTETTVQLSSGLIIFLVAIKILFTSPDNPRANLPEGEPIVFPLAVPLIAGPALLATIMLYGHMEKTRSTMLEAIVLAWLLTALILYFALPIRKMLGQNGLMACERLIGMVLVLIGVQRFMEGIFLFWTTFPHPS